MMKQAELAREESFEFDNNLLPRIDARDKAEGSALFCMDLHLPGMLDTAILRSPIPHARILRIDTSRAEKLIGVKAVMIGKDCPYWYGRSIDDQPVLAIDKVRYRGEPVAVVAATDEDIAEEAIDLIRVDYEEMEPVLDVNKAKEPGGPLVHEDIASYRNTLLAYPVKGTNVCSHMKVRKGDVDHAVKRADLIVEDRFTSPMTSHCYIEPKGAIAQMDSSSRITVWTGTGSPWRLTTIMCRAFGMSHNDLRVIVPYVGGSFGGKSPVGLEPIAMALAKKTGGKPVRVAQHRDDEFQNPTVKHPAIIHIKSGVKKDGTLVTREVNILMDTGAYACTGPTVIRNAGYTASGPYVIPNVKIDGLCVYTNRVPAGSLRGYGTQQVAWAYECHTDHISKEIGMDPLDFRLKNLYRTGSETATGEILTPMALQECLEKAAKGIGWKEKREYTPHIKRGKGIACMQKTTASPSASTAIVKMAEDGSVRVISSAVELGQGIQTVLATIVSNELKVPYHRIRVTLPDTDSTPFDESSTASRATFHLGNAVKAAAVDVKNQLLKIAGDTLEVPEELLEMKEGHITVKESPQRGRFPYSHFLTRGHYGKLSSIVGRGSFYSNYVTPIDVETGQSKRPTAFWMYAAQAAEVEVDLETGHVKVLKIVAAHDAGKAISLLGCKQQIEGAVAMGIGIATFEELLFDDKGRVMNPNFRDYRVPTAMDIPAIEAIVVEGAFDEHGPYGAKGLGEPALSATSPAIANAVYDAIGIRVPDLPLTPEKVLKAIKAEYEKP